MKVRTLGFAAILLAIAFVAPMVAFAGVTTIWPDSTTTANVNTSPPITFAQGDDYSRASSAGFAANWTSANHASSYTIEVSGLSGGNVTIDDLVSISKDSTDVTSYQIQLATALAGSLATIDTLKIRLWDASGAAPTTDASGSVCAVLDLTASLPEESTGTCTADNVNMQLLFVLQDGATGSSTVTIQPSSIVFAA